MTKQKTFDANLYKLTHPNGTESFVFAMNIADALEGKKYVTPNGNVSSVDKIEYIREVSVTPEVLIHHFYDKKELVDHE